MRNLLYRIGGYDPKIVKIGRFGAGFVLPGLSLMIVFITSSYGGWHLATTITTGFWCFPFTLGFVSLILLVDYLLLQGEKSKWTAGMRVILSVTMGFIISLLTCLVAFESDISSKYNRDVNADVNTETTIRKNDIEYWKTLPDSISKYRNLSVKAHKGDYVTERGEVVGKCKDFDQSNCPKGTYCRDFQDKAASFKDIYDDNKNLISDTSYISNAKKNAEARNSDGIIEQIKDLWALMMEETVVFVGVILFFIFLMVIDLMPISVKFGIKDTLDKTYKEFLEGKDENDNPLFYNTEKEKFNMENEKEKARIEIERLKDKEKLKRTKAIIAKLEETKKEYAEKKIQYVFDEIGRWYASTSQQKEESQGSEETIDNNQNNETGNDTR